MSKCFVELIEKSVGLVNQLAGCPCYTWSLRFYTLSNIVSFICTASMNKSQTKCRNLTAYARQYWPGSYA